MARYSHEVFLFFYSLESIIRVSKRIEKNVRFRSDQDMLAYLQDLVKTVLVQLNT